MEKYNVRRETGRMKIPVDLARVRHSLPPDHVASRRWKLLI